MRGSFRHPGGRESTAPDRRPPPPTPTADSSSDAWQMSSCGNRDSDGSFASFASFASSRPSSSFDVNPRPPVVHVTDRNYQAFAIRAVNDFLAAHSLPFSLKPPYPTANSITETVKFILSQFGVPTTKSQKIEDDFQALLKSLKCPIKLNRSVLRAPGTPHIWPNLLAVLHWLVQLLMYDDHQLNSSQNQLIVLENRMFRYFVQTYMHFIRGEDDEVKNLDARIKQEMMGEKQRIVDEANTLERMGQKLEEELEGMKSRPSERQALEAEKTVLELDVKKFHDMIEKLEGYKAEMRGLLEKKEKALEVKIAEKDRICVENEELKRSVEEQGINARDAERMKRELQALEGIIAEIEDARNKWEEKGWELDSMMEHNLEKLEQLMIECNQAMRRLKLGKELHYQLEAKGSSLEEVLGVDYKSILKPALASLEEEIKKSSMKKLEALISLQQLSVDRTTKIESKKNHLTSLQAHIDEVEGQPERIQRETLEITSRCASEAKKMAENIEAEGQRIELVEKEASAFLNALNAKLQEVTIQSEKEVQDCARQLFATLDSLSKYKEYVASKAAVMRNGLLETASTIANLHKGVSLVQSNE
ncbi:unnamed protein product [Cuscuta epithymum]|uniref:Kinetochore protein NDC80 n=1 Tax=Cuscuta epithymum TaxID=186058 RepID=A0AAV0CVG4_9ASTE|nr:unnamed protein product [Cuscuta epithymum]